MKKIILSTLWGLCCTGAIAGPAERDSLLDEITVTHVKENLPLRQQSLSSTSISAQSIKNRGIESVKELSALVPGLYIPNYGSRLTTSIYLRGIGSRTNTPSVGMYVDGLPWVDKSAFDFNIADVQNIEVLRGPQSTLYGRNTMGGLIRINTKNPLQYQGTDLMIGAATYNQYRASATHYHRISDRLGFSGGVSYGHQGGFFTNEYTGKKLDHDDDLATRFRLVARPSERVRLDFQANYEYSHQGAYPYQLLDIPSSDIFYDELVDEKGSINYNRRSKYDRHLLNLGLTAEHTWSHMVLSNVLGFQYLRDDMHMDQDFTKLDIYTLSQRQNSRVLSEEIALKAREQEKIQWTAGVNLSYQWLHTEAPVTFWGDGMNFLNRTINGYMPDLSAYGMSMKVNMTDPSIVMDGKYDTPMLNTALFGQITLPLVAGLKVTAGLRVDYERNCLDYNSWGQAQYDFTMMRGPVTTMNLQGQSVEPSFLGSLSSNSWKVLPKAALQYDFSTHQNVYASVSRGARSGGYNVQMFSELLQTQIKNQMMHDLRKTEMPELNVSEATLYKPEYAWNYEVGAHLNFFENRLQADASLYFTRITDQQLSQMSSTGLGRVTVNAGRSRSMGGEIALRGRVTDALTMHVNYGYTHATFRDYQVDSITNLRGNYVPFVPRHTLDLGGQYHWDFSRWLQHLTFSANWHAQGCIYWTEENDAHQNIYGTLDSRLTLTHDGLDLSLWGTNLTQQHYQAFYFESMSRKFAQKGRPLQIGIEVRLHI